MHPLEAQRAEALPIGNVGVALVFSGKFSVFCIPSWNFFCLPMRIFSVVLYSTALSVVYCLLQVLCNGRMTLFFPHLISAVSHSFFDSFSLCFQFLTGFQFLIVFSVSHCVFSFSLCFQFLTVFSVFM